MMFDKLKRRILSTACAAAMLFSSVGNALPIYHAYAETLENTAVCTDECELLHQTFELYPNGEQAEQVITLEGMMPDGAEASAKDVSDEYGGIAAYDISIISDGGEYHPDENKPILVEITDPSIPENKNIQLLHIRENGEREPVTDFTFSDGKISFYASGFSVYEIVEDPDMTAEEDSGLVQLPAKEFEQFQTYSSDGGGFYIKRKDGGYFLTGEMADSGIKCTSNVSEAELYYFEKVNDSNAHNYYIYRLDGMKRMYMYQTSTEITFVDSQENATVYYVNDDLNKFRCNNNKSGWTYNGNGVIKSRADGSEIFGLWYYKTSAASDPACLDGKTYGLMNFSGGTHGFALMADSSTVHSLVEIVTHKDKETKYYVDEGSEITRWTFHYKENGMYVLSAETDSGTKYLAVNGDSLVLADSESKAAMFSVNPDNDDRIQLSYNNKYVKFTSSDNGENAMNRFVLSTGSSADTWLNLMDFAKLDGDVTYSADRISISSESVNGKKVIVYTRIWNEETKKYDIYAVDHDGSLYKCYASGGKILWLGDGTGSLEWEFTEYRDEVTKEINHYYELYNPYSEKYLAPQLDGEQILSDSPIGLNMPGRRRSEFYSDIVAWDDANYAYIGMKPNKDNTKLVPCSQSTSVPFYFASLEELNLSGGLHTVPTVDNTEHGITMKMIDFSGTSGGEGATQQNAYLKNTKFNSENPTQGILSTNLNKDGYPTASATGLDLKDLYSGAETVNHLFIDSIYNSSGYFEFDSTQNFATLAASNDNNFTVYRELGTSDGETKSTLRHGQFFPYNTIESGNYSESNPENLYSADARTSNNNKGVLDENDPRKYEKLYSAGHKDKVTGRQKINYYFGMEMSAKFVQTVSGLDAWGHDIIFEFKGDDDFWLYVDDELVIDLGGIHSALSGNVNFRTGEVNVNGKKTTLREIFRSNYKKRGMSDSDIDSKLNEIFEDNGNGQYIFKDYTTHTMRVFYMERGAGASNIKMRFNLASVTPGHVVVSKSVSGEGYETLDTDFLEYPFQIYYTLPEGEDGSPGEEHLLENDYENNHIRVTYQNSNQPVRFLKKYRPPGVKEEDSYRSIYFINPAKNAEISFPDKTISYRIVECAVDSTVYDDVKINGVVTEGKAFTGNLKDYSSDEGTSEKKPTIAFENRVKDDVIKDLYITKKLLDENNNEITDDPATFNFRLYLSSVDIDADEMSLTDMYRYYVISPDKKICRRDAQNKTFVETGLTYSRDAIKALNAYSTPETDDDNAWHEYDSKNKTDISSFGIISDDVTFKTSVFGAISGIPSGYTVVVPGLPVGSVFKVTEDVKEGYGLVGYKRVMGDQINEYDDEEEIASYKKYEDNPLNVGKVIANYDPQLEVHNKKGYGLTVKKKWSDLSLTTAHEPIYAAVYADGKLISDSVRQLVSPATSLYYFWETLEPKSDGSPRTSFEGYEVKEVIINGEPQINDNGYVTNADKLTVTPVENGGEINLSATRTKNVTPEGEDREQNYDYIVSYDIDDEEGTSRTDTITNTRKGGIAIRLFKWDSAEPLKGGKFTLTDAGGKVIGNYTSDADGNITVYYDFARNTEYTLTQTAAPKGYVGLQDKLVFVVNDDDSVSMFYEDKTTEWDKLKWADSKDGENGLTAFVDVYNKPFNLKLEKTDSNDTSIKLDSAHFALYKQSNTTINGYEKNKSPMSGFEDMVTENGIVDICGGNSGRVIDPGVNGSVYLLTETKAPFNYTILDEDVKFRISPLGIPSLIDSSDKVSVYETDESFIFTLSVPNTVKDENLSILTIRKKVEGSFGNKTKDFIFNVNISGAESDEGYAWAKNGEEQTAMPVTGGTFTMKHNDKIEIALPSGVQVTVTEDNEEYSTTFSIDNAETVSGNSIIFTFNDSAELIVTNTLNGVVATGITSSIARSVLLVIVPILPISIILCCKRRRKQQ